jgi:hypothetical protein
MAPITVSAPQARAFITTVRPFTRPSRPISRDVRTRISPGSIDIMTTFDLYSITTSTVLTIFTMSKLIMQAAEHSVNSYDSVDFSDFDDDDF